MKAIVTKFLGATNSRGSRVKATQPDGISVTLSWDHELDAEQNHYAAARALCVKMQWSSELITGSLKNEYVHVFAPKKG